MMKSLANRLLKVAEGVLKDYTSAYPADIKDVWRDLSRLTLLVENRGLGVFTLDLPCLDAALLNGLQTQRLVLDGGPCKRASKRIHVPRMFRGIWLRIFDVSGSLREDPDPTAILFLRQLCCLGKKLEVGCTSPRTKEVLDEYRKIETSLHRPTLRWCDDDLGSDDVINAVHLCDGSTDSFRQHESLLWDERSHFDSYSGKDIGDLLRKCQRNFDAFANAIGKFEPVTYCDSVPIWSNGIGLKHGPGAVADLNKKEYKYDFPYWPAKLEARLPFEQFGCTNIGTIEPVSYDTDQLYQSSILPNSGQSEDGLVAVDSLEPSLFCDEPQGTIHETQRSGRTSRFERSVKSRPSLSEPFSRLYAVPKTAKGPRLIASEPTAHQWCQQLTRSFLESRLSGLFGDKFITLKDQEPSKQFAQRASLDGSMATVDLSSASDRLSCWLVERAFRSNPSVLRALHSHRTRSLRVRFNELEEDFLLRKFATQGTAVTFPVQSIIFFICAITASGFVANGPEDFIVRGGKTRLTGLCNKVRVFGDDIIIPKHGYDRLVLLLTLLGLKVNLKKSFFKGHFRESCGGDYFMGYDVTPVKTKSLAATGPNSRQALIDYSNNLFTKGFWNAAKSVESTIPRWVINNLPVIGVDIGGVGLTSFCGSYVDHLKKRWNRHYHRYEVRAYTLKSIARRKKTNSANAVLQYFSEAPCPTTKWEHGIASVPKTVDRLRWEYPYYGGFSETTLSVASSNR
nr:MAG: hypothetical protein 3 [Leviviridae sp.]